MKIAIGFTAAFIVGLTGVGAGSFTTPALMLIAGLSGAEAVGTALAFSTAVRLTAAPFYIAGKQVHLRYLWSMLLGAVPGLLAGTYLLTRFNIKRWNPLTLVLIGATLILSSALTLIYRNAQRKTWQNSTPWLPWLTLPIGIETGFSSAGAGALGTILLINCSELTAAQVVGTDLLFGIVLAAAGSIFHFELGSISGSTLGYLLLGGIPGVLIGCMLSPRIPSSKLKPVIIAITLLLGLQLVWSGMRLVW